MSAKKSLIKNVAVTYSQIHKSLSSDKKPLVRSALAGNSAIDPSIQMTLAKDDDYNVIARLANNPSLDLGVMDKLLKIKNSDLKRAVNYGLSTNNHLPTSVLERLVPKQYTWALDEHWLENNALTKKTRSMILQRLVDNDPKSVARNVSLTRDQIATLVAHPDVDVRQDLAANKILDRSSQLKLAKDSEAEVRRRLAQNPRLDSGALAILLYDEDGKVRRNLLSNDAIDNHGLKVLINDSDTQISSEARLIIVGRKAKSRISKKKARHGADSTRKNTDITNYRKVVNSADQDALIKVASDPMLPREISEILINRFAPQYDSWACVALAHNNSLSADTLRVLSQSKNLEVLRAVASNATTPLDVLATLAKHKEATVRAAVANPQRYELPSFIEDLIDR